MPALNMDSWVWKIALVLGLIGARDFVRLFSPREEGGEKGNALIETIDSAAIAIGLVLFVIQPFLLQAFFIPSGSMENTLQVGDRLLVSKLIYRMREPEFQDVVVFEAPPDAGSPIHNGRADDFIKRCIGTPGHTIEVRNRVVYRDGKAVPEIYTKWSPESGLSYSYDMKIVGGVVYSREYDAPNQPGSWRRKGLPLESVEQNAITNAKSEAVPPGYLLMLGDHRNNSNDGHVWGFVPRQNVVGKAIFVFWPITRVGLMDYISHHIPRPFAAPLPLTQ